MSVIKSLEVLLKVDNRMLKSDLGKSERMISNFSSSMNKKLIRGFQVGALAVGGLVVASIKRAMDVEKFTVKLAMLGGGAGMGIQLRDQMRKMALNSPFQEDQFFDTGARLLGAGVRADELMGVVKALGDTAAATGTQLNQVALVFSQVFAKGRLQGEEMLQFMERNISLYDALRKILGKSDTEVKKMIENGQVGVALVAQAFQLMTAEGGRFENAMEKLGKTSTGQFIKMFNSFNVLRDQIGQKLLPVVNALFAVMIEAFEGGGLDDSIRFIAAAMANLATAFVNVIRLGAWLNEVMGGDALVILAAAGAALILTNVILNMAAAVMTLRAAIIALEMGTIVGALIKLAVFLGTFIAAAAFFGSSGVGGEVTSEFKRIENAIGDVTAKNEELKKSLKDAENMLAGGGGAGAKLNVAPALWGTASAGRAFEVRGKAGKSNAERIADATEETADNTKVKFKSLAPPVAPPHPLNRDGGLNVPVGAGMSMPMAMPPDFSSALGWMFGR